MVSPLLSRPDRFSCNVQATQTGLPVWQAACAAAFASAALDMVSHINRSTCAASGQAIVNLLVGLPMSEYQPVSTIFPDEEILAINSVTLLVKEWTLHFNGALNSQGVGIGATLLTPEGVGIPTTTQLGFSASNNIAEYEALILGLRMALDLGARRLKIVGDLQLVIRQVLNKYKTHSSKLQEYCNLAQALLKKFDRIIYVHTLRSNNILTDSLASLAP